MILLVRRALVDCGTVGAQERRSMSGCGHQLHLTQGKNRRVHPGWTPNKGMDDQVQFFSRRYRVLRYRLPAFGSTVTTRGRSRLICSLSTAAVARLHRRSSRVAASLSFAAAYPASGRPGVVRREPPAASHITLSLAAFGSLPAAEAYGRRSSERFSRPISRGSAGRRCPGAKRAGWLVQGEISRPPPDQAGAVTKRRRALDPPDPPLGVIGDHELRSCAASYVCPT